METLVIHPQNEMQSKAIKAFAVALEIPFETDSAVNEEQSPYNKEFVADILNQERLAKDTKGVEIDLKNYFNL